MTQTVPLQTGYRAPDFSVPCIAEDRTISLADYRGSTPLLLGLFPSLYCPFCRRALAQMSATSEHLKTLGIDAVAIVGTNLENARLYFKFRPTKMTVGADPELATHRSYGVPKPEPTPELVKQLEDLLINPNGLLPEPMPVPQATAYLSARDGYKPSTTDEQDFERNFTQMKGQFVIDRTGIVRWSNIECAEGIQGIGRFPSHADLVEAASLALR